MAIRLRGHRDGAVRALLAAAAAATTIASSHAAAAFDVKKTPAGVPIHWYDSAVAYHIDPAVSNAVAGAPGAIAAAAANWSGVEGAPALSIVQGGGGATPGYDGINTIFYAPDGSALTGGALAVTVLTFESNGHVLDADIVIDGRYDFAVLPASSVAPDGAQPVSTEGMLLGPASSAPFDLQHIVGHELGHTLGLGDEIVDNAALMFLYSAPGAASPRAPVTDDTSGIASLYDTGMPTGSGCSAAIAPRTPPNGASRVALTLVLGLAAWALARRKRGAAGRALGFATVAFTTLLLLPGEHAARTATAPRVESPQAGARARARGRVKSVEVSADASGLFVTRAKLDTIACPGGSCPSEGAVVVYGGTMGDVHQEVGGVTPPDVGDEVDLAFDERTQEARIVRR